MRFSRIAAPVGVSTQSNTRPAFSVKITSFFPILWGRLTLDKTNVTDDGVRQLSKIPTLQRVFFEGTKITDAGLEIVAAIPPIRYIDVTDTPVTTRAIKELAATRGIEIVN
jgi:hypothetical protein